MGYEFKCGCRVSGSWYLCKEHEALIISEVEELEEEETERVITIKTEPLTDDNLDSMMGAIHKTQNPLIKDIREAGK